MNENKLDLKVEIEAWPLRAPFRITGYTFTNFEAVVVRLRNGNAVGRGEAAGVYYRNDIPKNIKAQIEAIRGRIEAGIDRKELAQLPLSSGARNAIDCALWDLETQKEGVPAWKLASLEKPPRPLLTTYTVGADDPHVMAAGVIGYTQARAIKLKLTGEEVDIDRVRAVRDARPDVWIGIDANQGFDRRFLDRAIPSFVDCDVQLIEQPFPIGQEADLEGLGSPIPIAADESVQGLADVAGLVGRFDIVNIKLDKCGGLTEGLAMVEEAQRLGLKVMVGNMMGTSLAMAPAFLIGQSCDVVDLDGPLALAQDRMPAVRYEDGYIHCAEGLWGDGVAAIP